MPVCAVGVCAQLSSCRPCCIARYSLPAPPQLPRPSGAACRRANPDRALLCLLAALGAGFSCASEAEVHLVLSLGIPADRVLLANPCKRPRDVRFAAEKGVALTAFGGEGELCKLARWGPGLRALLRLDSGACATGARCCPHCCSCAAWHGLAAGRCALCCALRWGWWGGAGLSCGGPASHALLFLFGGWARGTALTDPSPRGCPPCCAADAKDWAALLRTAQQLGVEVAGVSVDMSGCAKSGVPAAHNVARAVELAAAVVECGRELGCEMSVSLLMLCFRCSFFRP